MSLYCSEYIRDTVGHDPDKVLSLRHDEVSVFSRMNLRNRRKISLPTKLSGIVEKQPARDPVAPLALAKSYKSMKEKLDEMENYNKMLENQLAEIFSSISSTVVNAERSHYPLKNKTQKLNDAIEEDKTQHEQNHLDLSTDNLDSLEDERISEKLKENLNPMNIGRRKAEKDKELTGQLEHSVSLLHEIGNSASICVEENVENIEACINEINNNEKGFLVDQKIGLDRKRRVSSIDYPLLSPISELQEDPRIRRVSTGTQYELSHIVSNSFFSSTDKNESIPSISTESMITKTSSNSSFLSPNNEFENERRVNEIKCDADNLDELFLVSDDILDMDVDTICEELARISPDLENSTNMLAWKADFLKAARASYHQNTIWIYRGM